MFTQIIQKQIELNERITPDWRAKDWELAIIVETAEAIDSLPWKWWKAGGVADIDNLKVEAIDLLHFIISYGLSHLYDGKNMDYAINDLAETLLEEWQIAQDDIAINGSAPNTDHLKFLLSALLSYNKDPALRFSIASYWLFALMLDLGMDIHEVRAMYFAKNLLNEYRQERGYKDPNGNYRKVIDGVEDNVHFLAIVREIGADSAELKAKAFTCMDERMYK